MVTLRGRSKQILQVDMTRQSQEVWTLPFSTQQQYPSGRALALYLYQSLSINPGVIDPLGTENLMVFALGASVGMHAGAKEGHEGNEDSFTVVTKSPQTERICIDTAISPFATALCAAGWDALVIRGVYPSPGVMEITPSGAQFHRAKSFWKEGSTALFTALEEQFGAISSGEDSTADDSADTPASSVTPWGALGIGTAGALSVSVANLVTHGKAFGHGGMGAVLGAKQVKAIVARGGVYTVEPPNKELFSQASEALQAQPFPHKGRFGKKLSDQEQVELLQPLFHFQETQSKRKWKMKSFFKLIDQGYSGDMLLGFGSEIDNTQFFHIKEWHEALYELGLNERSMGHIIAWAMVANERDIRNSYLQFGHYAEVQKGIEYVGGQRGIAKERNLGKGLRWLCEKFQDSQPLPSVDGGDLPALQLPWGKKELQWASSGTIASLGLLFELRLKGVLVQESMTPEELMSFEKVMAILDILGLSRSLIDPLFLRPQQQGFAKFLAKLFGRKPSIPTHLEKEPALKLLARYATSTLGADVSVEELIATAERALLVEQMINHKVRESEGLEDELYRGKGYQKLLGLVGAEPTEQQLHRLHLDEL